MSENTDKMALLYAALARAQSKFKPIAKNREVTIKTKTGGSFRFRYADLEEVNNATRAALAEEGLSIVQPVKSEPSTNAHWLETALVHKDGAAMTSRVDLKPPTTYGDPKEFGAAVTYLRRYAITSLLNLAADDDLDANGQPTGDGDEGERVSSLLESLCAQVRSTTTDKAALDFWNKEKGQLAQYRNAYDEFKDATVQHRRSLKHMTEGATQ